MSRLLPSIAAGGSPTRLVQPRTNASRDNPSSLPSERGRSLSESTMRRCLQTPAYRAMFGSRGKKVSRIERCPMGNPLPTQPRRLTAVPRCRARPRETSTSGRQHANRAAVAPRVRFRVGGRLG